VTSSLPFLRHKNFSVLIIISTSTCSYIVKYGGIKLNKQSFVVISTASCFFYWEAKKQGEGSKKTVSLLPLLPA
jgi:hypothetical protein